jgi:hypothetical protein
VLRWDNPGHRDRQGENRLVAPCAPQVGTHS